MPQFQKLGDGKSSIVYMGVLGFGVNTERLKKLGIKDVPKCWKDLADPRFKNEIQMADPQSSGTAYTAIATFVQLWGEEQAFDYLKQLDQHISQYPKAGTAPSRNTARKPLLASASYKTILLKKKMVRQSNWLYLVKGQGMNWVASV
ncbi:hypothetical protein A4212_03925 [Pasteurella multocida]|nr:hypothetical protein AZI96_05850 [Pasteurella multocida]AUK25697.1 hypothetical protein A4211_03480 [Pasteurella multocida]AUK28471.1 hypothetical protein A4205_07255 [Pasteurella multocida]AUK30523.1 hypothetical protein A4216_07000 [Pasteurella multocida]AUK31989.1 hypothetical protein A4203_03865 [Pasteurella multocida]